jgi:hypothetical protein
LITLSNADRQLKHSVINRMAALIAHRISEHGHRTGPIRRHVATVGLPLYRIRDAMASHTQGRRDLLSRPATDEHTFHPAPRATKSLFLN